jgi:murein DD-endopeptidase MepM/ murein hydrolase activator NlpD
MSRPSHPICIVSLSLGLLIASTYSPGATAQAPALPNPFYAMDTCTKRPYPKNDIPPSAQLDMLKELGYAGIAWTEEPVDDVKAAAAEARKCGLKVFAIYCAGQVTRDGDLKYSPRLDEIIAALKGHETVVWLHIGGHGPDFAALTAATPVVKQLRRLADTAAANGLRVAVYPHVGEWTTRFGDAVKLARVVNHPQFGVTFNLCHTLAMGDENRIPDLLDDARSLLFAVTINGADRGLAKADWSRLIQTLDHGTYDTRIVLGKLRQIGYAGPIGLQGYGLAGDRRANLAASMTAWKKLSTDPMLKVSMRVVDLNVGESESVVMPDGRKVVIKLLNVNETRDALRGAVRRAEATLEIDGTKAILVSANYRLPTPVAGVQVDCPVTRGYRENAIKGVAGENPWGLDKDARIRLWPAGAPLLEPGTFIYPAKQRWFASATQMANEPVHVDGGENPLVKTIYYHYGLDIGGAEGLVEVVAATDGIVVSAGKSLVKGHEDSPAKPRYDVVYLLDDRGWYYRYSHLHTIAKSIQPGARVKMGQLVGLLGKEGGSGGWSHLHFDVTGKQPSGKWGIIEGYAFLWEAYQKQYQPKLLAVARPHHFAAVGEKVTLDGSRSWCKDGKIASFDWLFTDGGKAHGERVERAYRKPGVYSEVLGITDAAGRIDYDFAVVNVVAKDEPDKLPPSIHAVYYPTFGIKPGDPVTFLVRTFRTTDGVETWDFGDGSGRVEVQSDGNVVPLAKDGYARTVHRFAKAGHYVVRVERTNRHGYTAVGHVQVRVGEG